ncbi:Rz-like lysis system protein LysB [Glaciimonas sp. PAMC28666]|uniref:Rz-like lysis system protein LysB n=1 Tax=Glaciimonas sp. PAMC28666 TaxID=2807626 RepID=UPI00196579CE|nr:Rz-like lysis system protein LysB [Glaciimonas sp. PAMC28666]QRX80871.1 hypothetical protein JQN73_11585 [Glaciimonas sp. PAMC28666]
MDLILKLLIGCLLVGGLSTVIINQRGHLIAAKERAERAEQGITDRDGLIATLKATDIKNRKALDALQVQRDGIAATLSTREQHIKKLQHENNVIRPWAESPLPDAIARLRQRPALAGADAYRRWLSASEPLSSASERTRQ